MAHNYDLSAKFLPLPDLRVARCCVPYIAALIKFIHINFLAAIYRASVPFFQNFFDAAMFVLFHLNMKLLSSFLVSSGFFLVLLS